MAVSPGMSSHKMVSRPTISAMQSRQTVGTVSRSIKMLSYKADMAATAASTDE